MSTIVTRAGKGSSLTWTEMDSNLTNLRDGKGGLTSITTGVHNVALGESAGSAITTGRFNVAVGYRAQLSSVDCSESTSVGMDSLSNNSTGSYNTAVGYGTLRSYFGSGSTVMGHNAGAFYGTNPITCFGYGSCIDGSGIGNTAFGYETLTLQTTGAYNTAVGFQALKASTDSGGNAALGYQAMLLNANGSNNTAVGFNSLATNVTGDFCTALGSYSLWKSTGSSNTAFGYNAGKDITTGANNICIGTTAGSSLTTGSNNIIIGVSATPSAVGVSNEITLGSSSYTVLRTSAAPTFLNELAIPAGGTAGKGVLFSTTANFGTFFGSGAPSLTAAKGSLYLRSDGSNSGDRTYVNTDGGTTWTSLMSGGIVQIVTATTADLKTINATWTIDNSKPQFSEGVEVLTISITPTSATNKLFIEFEAGVVGYSGAQYGMCALFQDDIADSIAVMGAYANTGLSVGPPLFLSYTMTAGVATAITFKIRASGGNIYINGDNTGAAVFNGLAAANLRVTEIKV